MSQSICVCGGHLAKGYSGGRYHAWILGEALAASGASVTLWTTAFPQYAEDFTGYPGHDRIRCHIDPGYRNPPKARFDWVVVIPDRGSPRTAYEHWMLLAYASRARVALLNFESPNWFNAVSGTPIDESQWVNWVFVSRYCDLILSSAEESTRYARAFYTSVPGCCAFRSCPPAINTRVADTVDSQTRRRQIVVIARLGGTNYAHKGGSALVEAIGPEMCGYELVFLLGVSAVDSRFLESIKERALLYDVRLRFLEGLDDKRKFIEIRRSALMLFLSRFEGFGYPPVEALYCDTPCIVYDLPVLREISGDGLIYVTPGDHSSLRKAIAQVLAGNGCAGSSLQCYVRQVASFDAFVTRVSQVFVSRCPDRPIKELSLLQRFRFRLRLLMQIMHAKQFRVRRWMKSHRLFGRQSRFSVQKLGN